MSQPTPPRHLVLGKFGYDAVTAKLKERLDAITAALQPLGFTYITLDTQGYRSGSMNAALPLTTIAPARS